MSDSNILIYLDTNLVRNMSSIFLDGFIETKTVKRTVDLSLANTVRTLEKGENFYEDKSEKRKSEGFKDILNIDNFNYRSGKDKENNFANRGAQRIEEENRKTFTSFMFHENIISSLNSRHLLNEAYTKENFINCKDGDYVICKSKIQSESLLVYSENVLSIIKTIGYEKLNTLLKENSIIDFKTVLYFFIDLNNKLKESNTFDIITNCNGVDLVFNSNNNYFLNQNTHKFDYLNCNCNFLAKVSNNCFKNKSSIDLLRKTGNSNFYEQMLKLSIPVLSNLSKIGIELDKPPRLKIEKDSLQFIPISMYL